MTTYRIARTANNGRTITARYDFEGATLGEAFEAARSWWHLSSTRGLRCLGVVLAPLPQREVVGAAGEEMPDLSATNHGSIVVLTAHSQAGEDWIDEHIPDDALPVGIGVAVEPRYVEPIIEGALLDGLNVTINGVFFHA